MAYINIKMASNIIENNITKNSGKLILIVYDYFILFIHKY